MLYYVYYADMGDTLNSSKFKRSIADLVNSDQELIRSGERANAAFAAAAKSLVDSESPCLAGRLLDAAHKIPRYSYIKNLTYNGKNYEAEIDALLWRINIIAID